MYFNRRAFLHNINLNTFIVSIGLFVDEVDAKGKEGLI